MVVQDQKIRTRAKGSKSFWFRFSSTTGGREKGGNDSPEASPTPHIRLVRFRRSAHPSRPNPLPFPPSIQPLIQQQRGKVCGKGEECTQAPREETKKLPQQAPPLQV